MKRGEGTHKRGERWYWYWSHKLHTGGKQIERGSFCTQADAKRARRLYILACEARKYDLSYKAHESWTVRELCQWYIREYDELNNRKTTTAKTRAMCNHLYLFIGHIKIFELTNADLLLLKNDFLRHDTEATAYNVMRTIRKILNKAVEEGILDKSPLKTRLPGCPKTEHPTVEPTILMSMLHSLEGRDRAIIATAGMQGRRKSEIEGLQWDDLDFDKMLMTVRRQSVDGDIIHHLKSRRKWLVVPMTTLYNIIMKEWRLEAKPSTWVFPGKDPHFPMSMQAWRGKRWPRIKQRYGLPDDLRPHDLRHTFATILIAAGVSLAIVQELLGHASIRTTKDTYGHLKPEHLRQGLDVFIELYKQSEAGQ